MDSKRSVRQRATISGKDTETLFGNCLLIHVAVTVLGLFAGCVPYLGVPLITYGAAFSLYFLGRILIGRMKGHRFPELGLWQQLALYGLPLYGLSTIWLVLGVVERISR